MKIFITGGKGQLGSELTQLLELGGIPYVAPSRGELDVTDGQVLKCALDDQADEQPVTAVIHAAALTQVDLCEAQWEQAWVVNAVATQRLAQLCAERKLPLIYLSTDYIFDGAKREPYEVDDPPAPLNVYGASKLAGEEAVRQLTERHYIVRTAGVFSTSGHNFPRAILQAAAHGRPLRVVDDQMMVPIYAKDLAEAVLRLLGIVIAPHKFHSAGMLNAAPYGIYHITNQGSCSWWAFAQEIIRQAGWKVNVEPISSAELNRPARRPAYSVLSLASAIRAGLMLRSWPDTLSDFLSQLRMTNPELFPHPTATSYSEGGNQLANTLLYH